MLSRVPCFGRPPCLHAGNHREHAVRPGSAVDLVPWRAAWSGGLGDVRGGVAPWFATDTDGFDDFAVPLDLLLTRPVFGLAERITPNMSWRRFAINLARQPGVVASRAGTLGRELGAIAAGRSEIAPAKGDKRFADPAWRGNPLLSAPCRRTCHQRHCRINCFPTPNWTGVTRNGCGSSWTPDRRARAEQRPVDQSAGMEGIARYRRAERDSGSAYTSSPTCRQRRGVPSMVDPDAFTRGRDRRRDSGRGRLSGRGVRTDPVHASNRQGVDGAAADGAAGDQQVLHHGYRPRPQHDRVLRQPGSSGLHDLVAQSHRRTTRLGLRYLRSGDPGRAREGREDHRHRSRACAGVVFGRHPRRDDRRPSHRDRRRTTDWPVSP